MNRTRTETNQTPSADAPRRGRVEDVLRAVLDGDMLRAHLLVEQAGGAAFFDEDESLVEALISNKALGLGRADADEIVRGVRDGLGVRPTAGASAGDAALGRLASALGLRARRMSTSDPVVVPLGPTDAVPTVERAAGGGRARRPVFEPLPVTPSRPVTKALPPLDSSPANAEGGTGASLLRGFYRNVHEGRSWLPRVDMLAISIAPALTPGVYALQRRALPGARTSGLPSVREVRSRLGRGRPLPEELVNRLSPRLEAFGLALNLTRLRVHDDQAADDLCRELEAEAFALGTDLVFRTGAFRPDEPAGLELLLHELTHVWQQERGVVEPGVDALPGLEDDARRIAERMVDERFAALDPGARSERIGGRLVLGPELANEDPAKPVELDAQAFDSEPTQGLLAGREQTVPAHHEAMTASSPAAASEALQRCGPREMAKRQDPPRPGPKTDPEDPEPKTDPDKPEPEPKPKEPEPEPKPEDPEPKPEDPKPKPKDPEPKGDCETCPEPDLAHKTFVPMRELPHKKTTPGQKVVQLSLAGHRIKVEVPEQQAEGEVEVTFKDNPSPFAALVFRKAKLRFDGDLRVLGGEITCAVNLGKYIQVANTTLRVFEDGRIGAEIRGVQVNVADNLRALVDLVIGPEGVWGMCTVTADKIFVSDMVTVKDGLLHVRVEKTGSINAHGGLTLQVHGIGEVRLEACYVDGKWGGQITLARREELTIVPGVVLEEIELTGCFSPNEWWVYGAIKVRLFDKFRCTADARYHWKAGEGKWSFEADLEQIESVELGADVTLENTRAHVKYHEGEWDPATFHAELHHPWVIGTIDGTWKIRENLWSGTGRVELARPLPIGDGGVTLDQAEVTAHVVDNELTEIHGKVRATFPFQGMPTFELSCLDAVYKMKEQSLWATADLRSIRDIRFGREAGFHAIIKEGAGATAIVEDSRLVRTLGGIAFEARHADKLLGDGGMYFNWAPGGGVNAGGRFDLRERFGLPDYANGPLYLLPQPGHFEFLVENSEPKFIEAQGVGFEIAQGAGEQAGLIAGEVSGRFDFDSNLGDLSGSARVVRGWREELGTIGALTILEGGNLAVDIKRSVLERAEGQLDLRLDVNESQHVGAFSLLGHVDGRYDPKTAKVSGRVSAKLLSDLEVRIGGDGDKVVIKEGSNFETTMTEGRLDRFTLEVTVEYWRRGELFVEGACEECTFDFQTGLLDLVGRLKLKKDIEKALGQSGYSLALAKDVTQLEVEVRQNRLVRIGGDLAVQLRENGDPLLEGSLTNADYRIDEELFSGNLELLLMRDIGWPRRDEDAASLPPTLRLRLLAGSHVRGTLRDNTFEQALVELTARVDYRGKEQAEAHLDGQWDLGSDRWNLNGYFKLIDDLVLGDESNPDEKSLARWTLVFTKDSQVTVGIVDNALQPVGVDVGMQLRRQQEVCARGRVWGDYAFGQEGGFTGGVELAVVSEIALGRAGRFELALGTGTHGTGRLAASRVAQANLSLELFAKEGSAKKARLGMSVDYAGGSEFSGSAEFTVLEPIRLGQRQMGKDLYAVELNTRTRATIGLEQNELTRFEGAVGLDVLRGSERFAEGDFGLAYDFRDPSAAVNAEGAVRLLQRLELGTVAGITFSLEGGSSLSARIENSGLAEIAGNLKLGASTPREGLFATLDIAGRYVGGETPDFSGSAVATVLREHDLGFTAYNYGFFLQPSSGFAIVLAQSRLTEMHGAIGLCARQRSKKKGGMNGDVRASLNGDAVRDGEGWIFDGRATATVEGDIHVGTAGQYAFSIQGGTGIDIQVQRNRFVSVEGTLKGKVAEKGKDFLGFDCWVRYEAAENENDPGFVDARGGCKLLGEKELYRSGGFAFSLMPTAGYTALVVVERNEVKEVSGELAFRLENTNAKPQPLRVSGSASGHYDNTEGIFSGRGDIRLDSDLEFAMGENKIVLEKGSGGMTEIKENELQRLGGTLRGRFDDADGPLLRISAEGEFNAVKPELERLEGSATLLRELKLGPASNPWIIVDQGLSITARMAHNTLTHARGANGRFRIPALRIEGGFDHITMDASGEKTKYSGKGFVAMEMLKEDKAKGRRLNGRLDLDYREDDTWSARGVVDYDITPYLGGQLTAEMDQTLDPVLGGTLVMKKKEIVPARDLFQMKFPIIPDVNVPVVGIAGFGFGARGYFGLSTLPMTLSASVGVQNFRPRQMNVPDFSAEAEIDWGLRLKAGALAYLDARLSVLVASASIGIQGTAELAGDALVKAKGKLAGKQGKYWGELGIGLSFAPSVTLKAQPFAKASLFNKEWQKTWDAYTYDLGEVFKYEWGSTYKFGDEPEAPKANAGRQPAGMSGAPRQDTTRVNTKAEAEAFGEERASPAQPATGGRPQMESGEELKKKKEKKSADGMGELEEKGKEAADLGSVMAAVGNIITQLGHILGSLAFGPVGLVLCLAWKWITGQLKKLYQDWCTVRDYIQKNWHKIKEHLPSWFTAFVDFMQDPLSAAEKWWNADEYARRAVHAGEHIKAPAPVRGNLAKNLFAGWAGDGDRRAIEEIFEYSLNVGDLRQVIIESKYTPNEYASAWYRRREWAGSRLKRIFEAAGFHCSPSLLG